jgi:hypothetical protein
LRHLLYFPLKCLLIDFVSSEVNICSKFSRINLTHMPSCARRLLRQIPALEIEDLVKNTGGQNFRQFTMLQFYNFTMAVGFVESLSGSRTNS